MISEIQNSEFQPEHFVNNWSLFQYLARGEEFEGEKLKSEYPPQSLKSVYQKGHRSQSEAFEEFHEFHLPKDRPQFTLF